MKRVLVCHNDDQRLEAMIDTLKQQHHVEIVRDTIYLKTKLLNGSYDYLIIPITGIDESLTIRGSSIKLHEECLEHLKDTTILTGLIHPVLKETCDRYHIKLVSYLTEDFAIGNNYLTTEGVIERLVQLSSKAIYQSHILIVGYGKLGQVLSKVLSAFKANLTIVARDPKDLTKIKIDGHKPITYDDLEAIIGHYDFVITTVPSPVLHDDELSMLAKSQAIVLDVSSAPYSFDLKKALSLNVQAYRLPQIPAKVAPDTAGMLMANAILGLIGGSIND